MIQCLGRTGKTAVLGWGSDSLTIAQRPIASLTGKNVPSWSNISYERLGISLINICENQPIVVEGSLALIEAALRAIREQTVAKLQIISLGIIRILARVANTLAETDERELYPGIVGLLTHELPITLINGVTLGKSLLGEPIVSRPEVSFYLPSVIGLKQRLGRLARSAMMVTISVNTTGTLVISIDGALLSVSLTFNSIRILSSSTSTADPQRLVSIIVSLEQFLRVLSHSTLLPGCATICAIIPGQALVASVTLPNNYQASNAEDDYDDNDDVLTFYIPPVEI